MTNGEETDGMGEDPEEDDFGGMTYGQFMRLQLETFHHQSPDWILSFLVEQVNQHEFSFGVTLFVHGAVVSGDLVSVQTFMHEVASLVEEQAGDQHVILSIPFRTLGNQFQATQVLRQVSASSDVEEDPSSTGPSEEGIKPINIHLRNAHVFLADMELATGIMWRGRLESVNGWSIGTMQQA